MLFFATFSKIVEIPSRGNAVISLKVFLIFGLALGPSYRKKYLYNLDRQDGWTKYISPWAKIRFFIKLREECKVISEWEKSLGITQFAFSHIRATFY